MTCEIDGKLLEDAVWGFLFRCYFGTLFGVLLEVLFGGCCERCWCAIVGMLFATWGLCCCNLIK